MNEQVQKLFMELINLPALAVATLIPMVLGFIWYNPKTPMGAAWMKETGMTDEKMKGANMGVIFGLSILFSLLMNFVIVSHEVIHQWGAFSLLKDNTDEVVRILTDYKDTYRTFQHGVIHGGLLGVFFVFPLFATNGMFERKSWKLILVNVAYWTLALMLMGGVLCAWQ